MNGDGSAVVADVGFLRNQLCQRHYWQHIANHRAGDVPVQHRATHRYSHQYVCPDLSEHRRELAVSQGKDTVAETPTADTAGSTDSGRLAPGCVVAPAGSTAF